ncbi:MAG: hypothetical protein IPJ69_08015 [Deltaproteobacteria bacterium]|nr:MAG: hypothetical protein IPJ69_08015 [Deltaproteobacteria bacterium]
MGFSEEEKNLAEILFGHSVDAHSALQNIQFYIHARQQLRARGQEVGPAPESLSLLFEVWNQKPEMVAQVVKRFLNTDGQSTSFVMPGREFPYGHAQLLNFAISMPAHPAIRAVADDIAHELTQWVEDCRQKAVAAYAQNDTSPYYRYNDVAVSTFLRSGHRGSLWPLFFLTRYYRATGQQDALEKLKPIVGDVVGLMHLKKCRLDETHLAKLPIQWGALNGQDYIQPNFFGEGTKGFLPWVYGDMGPGSQTAMMLLLAYEHFGVDEIVVEKMTLKNILENMINNADLSVPQMPEMRDQESQKYGSQLLEFPHGWNVTRMMLFGVVAGLDGLDESVRAASKEAAQALLLMKLK